MLMDVKLFCLCKCDRQSVVCYELYVSDGQCVCGKTVSFCLVSQLIIENMIKMANTVHGKPVC